MIPTSNETIRFKRLDARAKIPAYAHEDDSGMDIAVIESVTVGAQATVKIRTGLAVIPPPGYEMQVRPRSGLSARGVMAAFGTVDNGYRGEVCVVLTNLTEEPVEIAAGDRVAQFVCAPVRHHRIVETHEDLGATARGAGGFGSTGAR